MPRWLGISERRVKQRYLVGSRIGASRFQGFQSNVRRQFYPMHGPFRSFMPHCHRHGECSDVSLRDWEPFINFTSSSLCCITPTSPLQSLRELLRLRTLSPQCLSPHLHASMSVDGCLKVAAFIGGIEQSCPTEPPYLIARRVNHIHGAY